MCPVLNIVNSAHILHVGCSCIAIGCIMYFGLVSMLQHLCMHVCKCMLCMYQSGALLVNPLYLNLPVTLVLRVVR